MITSVFALMTLSTSAFHIYPVEQDQPENQYIRPDTDYNGEYITCINATYCTDQQALYNASINGDTTQAPRYVINGLQAVEYNSTQINMTLTMTNNPPISSWSPGNNLLLTLNIYQNGLLQVNIANLAETFSRFKISDYNVGVEWGQLQLQTFATDGTGNYQMNILPDGIELSQPIVAGQDSFDIKIQFSPFRIVEYSNSQVLVEINHQDTLFFQSGAALNDQSISMGFFVNAQDMFGIPERAAEFKLNYTQTQGPYRLWNQDMFNHPWGSTWPLYGSIPYLLGHAATQDASIAWLNSAETWVDLFQYINAQEFGTGTHASFTSEGGAMEFFIFGSTLGPKQVNKALSELSGYAPIPSINSLGFHYCKWEYNSADMMIERSDNFTKTGFPVDVLWSDIEYSENKQYFVFNQSSWPQSQINRLNNVIDKAQRRMVLITDCHVSYNTSYPVYTNGLALDQASQAAPNFTNIYVRQPDGINDFVGNCWPGPSVWLDYLNANAQQYWASLYSYKNFNGQTYLYGAWNDMNEPSVFADGSLEEISQRGMPVHNIHIDVNGNQFEHMYVHNAYGALQQNSTYMGLMQRDGGQNRPFMLTRSFFLGSQRYSGMWTGDSQTNYENVEMSVNMLLSLGVSGIVFGGCDIPGFYGEPDDDLFVQFYQLGVFYPFMRAHNNIPRTTVQETDNFSRREPWLQSDRIQKAIKQSVYQRYAQIHYLYTAFYQANKMGTPIIRPMWMEFPQDPNTFSLESQFMFGDNMLIAPKLGAPLQLSSVMNGIYNISMYLPPSSDWYFYNTKAFMNGSSTMQNIIVGDDQYGTFIRAGTVLPILNYALERYSILQAINDPLRLEVFPDSSNMAFGQLYLDDYSSHQYLQGAYTLVNYNLTGSQTGYVLSVTKTIEDAFYFKASNKMIDEIVILNVLKNPTSVFNRWLNSTPYPYQGNNPAAFVYLPSTKELHIYDLNIPVDDGLVFGIQQDLIEVVF